MQNYFFVEFGFIFYNYFLENFYLFLQLFFLENFYNYFLETWIFLIECDDGPTKQS